jgi:hypothetical protein
MDARKLFSDMDLHDCGERRAVRRARRFLAAGDIKGLG